MHLLITNKYDKFKHLPLFTVQISRRKHNEWITFICLPRPEMKNTECPVKYVANLL